MARAKMVARRRGSGVQIVRRPSLFAIGGRTGLLGRLSRCECSDLWLGPLDQVNLRPVAFEFRSGVFVNVIQRRRAV
jgi:hypothetical protein